MDIIEQIARKIIEAENALGELTAGQRTDLILDNFRSVPDHRAAVAFRKMAERLIAEVTDRCYDGLPGAAGDARGIATATARRRTMDRVGNYGWNFETNTWERCIALDFYTWQQTWGIGLTRSMNNTVNR